MKHLLLLLVFFTQLLHAQNRKIDSLNNLIRLAKTDTARLRLMNAKADAFMQNSLDSVVSITSNTITEAQKIQDAKAEANAFRLRGVAKSYKGSFATALPDYQSAEKLYRQASDSDGLNNLYRGYGMYYGMQSKYDSSIIFFKKNIAFYEKNKNISGLTAAYQNIAVSYTMRADYQNALFYQNKALKLAEEKNDINNMAFINANMAISYSNVGDYQKCEELNLKAIRYARQEQIKNVELYAYANLASNSSILGRAQETVDYALKAAALGKQLGDYPIVASTMSRAAASLATQKKFTEAETLGKEAMHIADSVGVPLNIYQTYADMGFIKNQEKKYGEAVPYFEKAFASLKDADIYDVQIGKNYSNLAEAYENTAQFEKALSAYKTATKITDSIQSRQNIRRATELSMNYAFDKKEQAAKAEQDRKNAITNARQMALLIGLICMAILIVGAIVAYRNKQKINVQLRHQKDALQQTLAELKATQAQLIQSEKMASLGELTAGIAHEIQNPLNFVNNFSEVNNELIDEMNEETDAAEIKSIANAIKQNNDKINYHGKRADAIVKGMLQHSRQNKGIKESTDINALCDEYLRLSYHGLRAKDKSFNSNFTTDFDPNVSRVEVVPQNVGRVLLNLFNNAFYAVTEKKKRAGAEYKPTVTVETRQRNEAIEIRVTDNGTGIPQAVVDKIFQPFFTTKPTGQGTGLGLSLSYDIITKEHNGMIRVESHEGEGSTFIITLPIAN